MARLQFREPDLGGGLAGDGPDPLLRALAWVVGMVFDGGGLADGVAMRRWVG